MFWYFKVASNCSGKPNNRYGEHEPNRCNESLSTAENAGLVSTRFCGESEIGCLHPKEINNIQKGDPGIKV